MTPHSRIPKLVYLIKTMERNLPRDQLMFLICWFLLMGEEGGEFGFITVNKFEDQLRAAIDLLKRMDKQWQKNGVIRDVLFCDFFEMEAAKEGVGLPIDFARKISRNIEDLKEDL